MFEGSLLLCYATRTGEKQNNAVRLLFEGGKYMRNCPNCGNAVQDGCLFCTHCGEKLEERPIAEGMPVQEAMGGEAPVQNSVNAAQAASGGAASQETKEKKGGKPYFLIGLMAVLILVLVGVFVLGKTVLSMGLFLSPKQKFLKYQADYFNEKLNDLDKLEIFPLTKKNITFTINGEVRGNKEVAKYLEDSSIVVKTKTNPEKGSYQASLLFNIMGEDVLDAYGEYADGKLGLAFPSLEKKFYQGELQSILNHSSDEEIELPNFNKKKENRKLAEKLFKKYGSLLAEFFTEENFTVEKGSFTMPIYGEDFEEEEFEGTIYRFKPSAEDLEGILEKFADKLEKDEDCAKFLIQSGLGIMISEHIGYDEFIDESRLSDFADWLRENAEELAEELEEKHIMWVLTMEGKEVRKIQIGTDIEDDDEFKWEDGDRDFLRCTSGSHKKIKAEAFYFSLREDDGAFYFRNVYEDNGKTLDGEAVLYVNAFMGRGESVEYSVEKGKKDKILALPYGEYDFSNRNIENARVRMTVKAGKKNSTDYEIKISDLDAGYLPGIKSISIHVNAKEGADLSKPKGKTVDISDYTLYEVNELGEEFSEELSNIGEEIFGN